MALNSWRFCWEYSVSRPILSSLCGVRDRARASCMLGNHSVSSAISPAPACGSLKGGRQAEVFLRLVTDMPRLSICTHPSSIPLHLPTSPQVHHFHFCKRFLPWLGPQRGQRRAKQELFLEGLQSFSICCQGLCQVFLRPCWLRCGLYSLSRFTVQT